MAFRVDKWAGYKGQNSVTFGYDTTNRIEGLSGVYKRIIYRPATMDECVDAIITFCENKFQKIMRSGKKITTYSKFRLISPAVLHEIC